MKKYVFIAGLFAATVVLVISWVLLHEKQQDDIMKLPPEIVTASKEFKAQASTGFRDSEAKKLRPYLRKGMSREQVEELLGNPAPEWDSKTCVSYVVGYSQLLSIDFDEDGNVIRVTGIDDGHLNHYELTWPLIRSGKTREYVLDHLGEAASESADGKRWDYVADGRTYTVIFDEQGLVESVEPSHTELE